MARQRRRSKGLTVADRAAVRMLDALLARNHEMEARRRPVVQHRPPMTLAELLAEALQRLPGTIDHDTFTQSRRPEEIAIVFFDGHSQLGQEEWRVARSEQGYEADIAGMLAMARASGQPWTWCVAVPRDYVGGLLSEIKGVSEEVRQVAVRWSDSKSPHDTVRVVLLTDGAAEAHVLDIERENARPGARVRKVRARSLEPSTGRPSLLEASERRIVPALPPAPARAELPPASVLGKPRELPPAPPSPGGIGRRPHETYRQERTRCGKATCRCASGRPDDLHGPYWYAYWTKASGTIAKRYLGKHFIPPSSIPSSTAAPSKASSPPDAYEELRLVRARMEAAGCPMEPLEPRPLPGIGRGALARMMQDPAAVTPAELLAVMIARLPAILGEAVLPLGLARTVFVGFNVHSEAGERAFRLDYPRHEVELRMEHGLAFARACGAPWTFHVYGSDPRFMQTVLSFVEEERRKEVAAWCARPAPPGQVHVVLVAGNRTATHLLEVVRQGTGPHAPVVRVRLPRLKRRAQRVEAPRLPAASTASLPRPANDSIERTRAALRAAPPPSRPQRTRKKATPASRALPSALTTPPLTKLRLESARASAFGVEFEFKNAAGRVVMGIDFRLPARGISPFLSVVLMDYTEKNRAAEGFAKVRGTGQRACFGDALEEAIGHWKAAYGEGIDWESVDEELTENEAFDIGEIERQHREG